MMITILSPRFHQSFHQTIYGLRLMQRTGQRPLSHTRRMVTASISAEELRSQSCGGQCGKCVLNTLQRLPTFLCDVWHYSLPTGILPLALKLICHKYAIRDTPRLSSEEITDLLPAVPDWETNAERTCISKSFVAKNFKAGGPHAMNTSCV